MLPDLSRLTLGPAGSAEQTGSPADFTTKAIEKAKVARRDAVQSSQAAKREESNARRRFPELYGSRTHPGVLKSTEEEHQKIAALLCYTWGWDAMLSNWLDSNRFTTPTQVFRKLVKDAQLIKFKEAYWTMYAMFMDDAEFLRYLPGGEARSVLQFSVDPVKYCELDPEAWEPSRKPRFENLGMKVSSIPNIVVSRDLVATTKEVVPTEAAILTGVRNLLPKLFDNNATDHAAAASLFDRAVEKMAIRIFSCFEPISRYPVASCTIEPGSTPSGKYVLYRGATTELERGESHQDAAKINEFRLVSASRSIVSAMNFVDNSVSQCCLNVFLLDPDCQVIDVNVFMGTSGENKGMICHKDECELIMKPGGRYEKLGSTENALQDPLIKNLIGTNEYSIANRDLEWLKAQLATWWLVRPQEEEEEDSEEDSEEETDRQTDGEEA